VTIEGDVVRFDGDPVDNRLTRHLVEMIKGGDGNYTGYVLFLENLKSNPSKNGQKGLFRFLDKNDLTITEDGCFIGYKGVATNGKSITAGNEDVTVTLDDGTVETHKGHIPFPAGATVEMARSLVDPDRSTACSVGLHVGTFAYSQSWANGGLRLTVKVNPRDVVEVPNDSNGQKLRACRVTVLEVNGNEAQYEGTSFTVPADDLDDDSYEDDSYLDDDYYEDDLDDSIQ
jgi:hypothetical protein